MQKCLVAYLTPNPLQETRKSLKCLPVPTRPVNQSARDFSTSSPSRTRSNSWRKCSSGTIQSKIVFTHRPSKRSFSATSPKIVRFVMNIRWVRAESLANPIVTPETCFLGRSPKGCGESCLKRTHSTGGPRKRTVARRMGGGRRTRTYWEKSSVRMSWWELCLRSFTPTAVLVTRWRGRALTCYKNLKCLVLFLLKQLFSLKGFM